MGASASKPKAVVAIELGTRRSGWAFSLQGKAEGNIFVRVPEGNHQGEKTETAALLSSNACGVLSFGQSARERYAENKASGRLFLDFMKDFPKRDAVAECGRTVPLPRLVAAVLGYFKNTALEHLASASAEPVVVTDIAWVITVPATYDTVARQLVRDAAVEGGINDATDRPLLKLCVEPKAAYLAMYDLEPRDLGRGVGEKIMIVDCGASTMDITAYEVVSSLYPVHIKQLIPATTEPWGSTCVDKAFVEWFKEFIGEDAYSRVRLSECFLDFMSRWEDGKTNFGGKSGDRVRLNMADIAFDLNFDSNKIQV